MINRTIIPGPPGTGKTWTLVNKYLKLDILFSNIKIINNSANIYFS